MSHDESEGLHPRASAVEALLDQSLPLQVQHAPKRGKRGVAKCGATSGQVLVMPVGVTCPDCKPKPGLTKSQAKRVIELVEDEGYTRKAAMAEVRHWGTK